jgi:hypothetical protein
MNQALTTYFAGEKQAGLMLAGIGLVMWVGAVLLFPARLELRPFAITLAVWGGLELAIGIGLFARTGPQVERLTAQLASDAAGFFSSEGQRMAGVQRNFAIIEAVWLVLIIISATVAWYWKGRPTLGAIALGVLINTSIFLAFDVLAERRGSGYVAALGAKSQ